VNGGKNGMLTRVFITPRLSDYNAQLAFRNLLCFLRFLLFKSVSVRPTSNRPAVVM
jgi:hypothetical protein